MADCCWAPSVRYQSTVSSRIRTTCSPVITAREVSAGSAAAGSHLGVDPRRQGQRKDDRGNSLQHGGGGLLLEGLMVLAQALALLALGKS